ncbi:hypothetical protein AB6A23_21200 [Paenibacillus tarimensis]
MRRLFGSDGGSVSIYFIVVTAGIFVFNAVLIDYARVAAMNLQLESAARSAVRSVLSAYDDRLYSDYGLFARGGSEADEIFGRVLEGSLRSGESKSFRLLDVRIESGHVNHAQLLGQLPVFRRQVLEEMKYKAPIDFTMEIVNKFKPLSTALGEAAATVSVLDQMQKLYEARERDLEGVIGIMRSMANQVVSSGISGFLQSNSGAASSYPAYVGMMNSAAFVKEEQLPPLMAAIAAYRQGAASAASESGQLAAQLSARHVQMQADALFKLEQARELNEQMRMLTLQGKGGDSVSSFNRLSSLTGAEELPDAAAEGTDMQDVRDMTADLVMEPEWFDAFKEKIARQAADFAEITAAAEGFEAVMSAALASPSLPSGLSDAATNVNNLYLRYEHNFIQPAAIVNAMEEELQSKSSSERERKELKRQADNKWSDAKRLLQRIEGIKPSDEDKKQFQELKARYEQIVRLNQTGGSQQDGSNGTGEKGDAGKDALRSLTSAGEMLSSMADVSAAIRDALYLNEYAVHRFSSYSPDSLKGLLSGDLNGGAASGFGVHEQEAEYILYGFHHPVSNVAAAYAEIFSVRLAIRTMEGLVECRTMAHPLVIFSAALVYGLEKAMEDIVLLVKQGQTPLSKYAAVQIAYKDYLRLFLLIHGSEETKMNRMMAVIEHATGYRLHRMAAAVTGEVDGSVKLWFLPGLMKGMSRTGLLKGRVVGNRYESKKTVAWSYM